MKRNTKYIDELLVKHLLGEATEAEQQEVQQWLAADPANSRYFDQFRLIWDESRRLATQSTVNADAAWEKFQQRLQNKNTQPRTIPLGNAPKSNWMRVAASLLLFVGCAGVFYYFMQTSQSSTMLSLHSGNSTLVDTLPDGSIVTLNKNSSVSFPSHFQGNTRSIQMQGEAFFNITPNKHKPFIIQANDVTVQVVGTSFNVKSTVDKTEVIVATGIVQVSKEQHTIKVTPHEKATVLKGIAEPQKEQNADELYNYYKTKELVCNGTPLWRLVAVLNEMYDAHIVIANPRLRDMPLTTTFHNESLDKVLEVVKETFNITVEKSGNKIILK